jgi:alcohol dehydrogenase
MKAWRLEKAGGRLSLEEVPVPSLRSGTALVRLSAAPVLSYMGDVLAGKIATIYRFPDHAFTPGTNGAGTVEAVGPAVFHLRAGQRVVLNPHFVADERGVDPAQILIGPDSAPVQEEWPDGTFAEYALMPAGALTPSGAGLAPERLATLGKFTVPYGGFARIGLEAGETVIVNGATGYFGSAAALLAAAMGAARVVAAGRDAATLASIGAALGPRGTVAVLTGDAATDAATLRDAAGGGAHAAIDLVGRAADSSSTVATMRALRRGGRLALMGSMTVPLSVGYGELVINDLTIVGQFMYPKDSLARLVAMARSGVLDLAAVQIRSFPLAELPAAMAHAAGMRGLQATVLRM